MQDLNDKEDRAFEAFIVKRMREGCKENPSPPLPEEAKALDCLKPGYLRSLRKQFQEGKRRLEARIEETSEEFCGSMNRAEDVDETTNEELNARKKSAQQRMEEERNAQRDS